MKGNIVLHRVWALLVGFVLAVGGTSAQTVAYRQTNLSSDAPGLANHINLALRNPWGIAVAPGMSFFIADASNGRVISQDASGSGIGPAGFNVLNPARTAPATLTGIISDPASIFGSPAQPFIISTITATEDGGIYIWVVNADGSFLQETTLVVDHSQSGAVYTSLAILKPDCCAPSLAVVNFHSGRVETYSTDFAPLGSFSDPSLPAGFAPYGMQVIGKQLFIASALQDAAKHDPVFGAGNGIVSVFDLEGRFIRRFATAGPLNTPWGITQASASFGPFSHDILIGNVGDGIINAFDPVTGDFAGQIKDGDGNTIVNSGLHALVSGSDDFGDPHTLYFTAGINDGQDGLFGAITTGLVSTTRVSVPPTQAGASATITTIVSAAPGNPGMPTGLVALQDAGVPIAEVSLASGEALFNEVLTGPGVHLIEARFGGDTTFLPSTSQIDVQVTGFASTLTLTAPANAAPGSVLTLKATIQSADGIPTGQIAFLDGNTNLGSASLDDTGVAILRTNTLTAGIHSLTASYAGDGKFDSNTSPAVTIDIASADFSVSANPSSTDVVAGQSAPFMLTITPAAGFAGNVTFSCSPIAGITCTFNPAIVTPADGAASTILTVSTSANFVHSGAVMPNLIGPGYLLGVLALFSPLLVHLRRRPSAKVLALSTTAAVAIVALLLVLGGCGGSGSSVAPNPNTASILVTAQSGAISHTTIVRVTVQ